MKRQWIAVAAVLGAFTLADVVAAQVDPNPAMNNPDKQAWDLFLMVNAKASGPAGANNALFETWASDGDTFQPKPAWPTSPSPVRAAPRALSLILQEAHAGVKIVPGNGKVAEETRRNRADFDFIVNNNLHKVSGLRAAFAAGKPLVFPVDSVEVKANWVELGELNKFNGFSGSPADAAKLYHVNSVAGKTYALVAFHIISKLVPNWTWGTFEHKDNLGRCDVMGCVDTFGAQQPRVAPKSLTESKTRYGDCPKSPALTALFARANIDPAFANYCLKGSQVDFSDATGLTVRLGNSVTEEGFVAQASCMSCHGRAAFDQTGRPTTFAGFDPFSISMPRATGNAPLGPPESRWYWAPGDPPFAPALADAPNLQRVAMAADFVWSIPFCAIDDTATPPETKSRFCAGK